MLNESDINISIVCPNSLAKEGLRRILVEDQFNVSNSFQDASPLLADGGEIGEFDQDGIILFETYASNIDQEVAALRAKYPNCGLVLLTDTFEFNTMIDVFRAGADGYIIKDIECQSLIESLKLVALGEKVLPSQLVKHLPLRSAMSSSPQTDGSELLGSLSEREVETLRCLIMGYPNKVIAYRLDISEATVKVHVKAILRKLGVQNRTQAAIWAVNHGLDANAACATLAAESSNDTSDEAEFEMETLSATA
ncbi:MAG: response regulator transcription factor [Pseudomonadota bacterium]